MMLLVPSDFSENANNAVEYALEIAGATNGRVVLLHVLHDPQHLASEREEAAEKLRVVCDAIRTEFPTVTCEIEIRPGNVVKEILHTAEEKRVGMIVMGTKGATNLGRLFFGSNTASVIENATCPVLSIPGNYTFRKPEKMLFSTNFTREDVKGAVQLVMLAKAFGAGVVIAHVMVEHEREEIETSMIQIFSREVAHLTDYENITYKALSDNTVSMGLDSLMSETNADLIALFTRKRSLFEKLYNPSITQKYSLLASIPLLAFHHGKE
jgi:nucleotide-binding universal stress UspA family protein